MTETDALTTSYCSCAVRYLALAYCLTFFMLSCCLFCCWHISSLPAAVQHMIEDMGINLHDAHTAPAMASDFESRPRELLRRLDAAG